MRYGLDELVLTSFQNPWLGALARLLTIGRKLDAPRGQRLRQALEQLGPIFVKFGQVLSTRRDLLPPDIADELARLRAFEVELNALVRRYFPHWEAKDIVSQLG